MTRDEKFINLAIKISKQSAHKFPIGAVITKGNKIISVGVNKNKTHPCQINYHLNKNGNIHAELDAIILCESDISNSVLYVARLLKNGDFGIAKPCSSCMKIIGNYGIKKIIYTNYNGFEEIIM